MHTNYKNITTLFSFGMSWKFGNKNFKREINYYKKLINNFTLKFVTFGNNNDLNFSKN